MRFVALQGAVVAPGREATQEVGASQAAEERGVADQRPWPGGLRSGCHDHADQKGCNGDQAQAESCNSEVEDALLSRRPGRPCHHLRSYSTRPDSPPAHPDSRTRPSAVRMASAGALATSAPTAGVSIFTIGELDYFVFLY